MSNLRWILLFAGFAILLLLYFSGRPRKSKRSSINADGSGAMPDGDQADDLAGNLANDMSGSRFDADALAQDLAPGVGPGSTGRSQGRSQGQPDGGFGAPGRDVLMDGNAADYADPYAQEPTHYTQGSNPGGQTAEPRVPYSPGYPQASAHPGDPSYGQSYGQGYGQGYASQPNVDPNTLSNAQAGQPDQFSPNDVFDSVDPDDWQRPGGAAPHARAAGSSEPFAASQTEDHVQSMGASIGEKIEAFSARLSPRRKSRVAASTPTESRTDSTSDTKIVSLHVVAPQGRVIAGQLLLDTFEARGYHHGDMNIFHSLHNGNTVFSIAKMVVPGTFDINDPASFETPGLSLFLQLPGPVPGDVAFEVLISEAYELAHSLGCNILDSERSTLSRQTVQHLRESVYEYMHRQKYFNKAAAKVPG